MRNSRKNAYEPRPARKISEIDFDELSQLEIEEINSKLNKWKNNRPERKCYNCHCPDHLLADCPEPVTRFFCFKCGKEGCVTPKCPNCSPKGNRSAE